MSQHSGQSQARLHDLFKGFAGIVARHIEKSLLAITADARRTVDEPIRVLDLGAGSVPYSDAFRNALTGIGNSNLGSRGLELTCLDNYPGLEPKQIAGCSCDWKVPMDALTLARNLSEGQSASQLLGGPFDLVILSASLHEFYNDAVEQDSRQWNPGTFHRDFLAALCKRDGLVANEWGRVIIADYAWSELADPKHLYQIAEAQYQIAEHADPPWSFARPRAIMQSMMRAEFRLHASESHGLFDQLDDADVARMFSELSEDVRETLRLRIGYVLTFQRDSTPISARTPLPDVQHTLLRVARATTALFGVPEIHSPTLRSQLNQILTEDSNTGLPQSRNLSPLVTLGRQIYRDGEQALQAYAAPGPGVSEVWFGIGLRAFERSRFVPLLRPWWGVDNERVEAGVFITCGAAPTLADTPQAGPVAIAYNHVLSPRSLLAKSSGVTSPPTIHNWCVNLHRSLASSEISKQGSALFRSVTLLSPYASAHDRAIGAAWGSEQQQLTTGHYLIRFYPGPNRERAQGLSLTVRAALNEIARKVLGSPDVSWLPPTRAESETTIARESWLYSVFLSVLFGFGTRNQPCSAFSECLADLEAEFERFEDSEDSTVPVFNELLNELERYASTAPPVTPWPKYTAYTTLALGCDGLSGEDPNTVMLFASHPFPPKALDRIAQYTIDLTNPIVQAEYTHIARQTATRETAGRLTRAFGHDAKRPASLICDVLARRNWPSEVKQRAAMNLASSLEERLAGFSSIIAPKQSKEQIHDDLWNAANADRLEWEPVAKIFSDALALSVLSICLGGNDAWWNKLRTHVGLTSRESAETMAVVDAFPALTSMLSQLRFFPQPVVDCDLQTLKSTENIGGSYLTYPVYHALRLVLSEILTNALKYELYPAVKKNSSAPLCFSLTSTAVQSRPRMTVSGATPVLAALTIKVSPAKHNYLDWIPKTYNGLLSLRTITAAIGSTIPSRTIPLHYDPNEIDAEKTETPKANVELPFFSRVSDDRGGQAIEWTIQHVPLFLR